jgi:serine protease AprX
MALLLALAVLAPIPALADDVSVGRFIVQETEGAGEAPERLVERLGGTVVSQLGVIGGFVAELPLSAAADLARHSEVFAVTPDASLSLSGFVWADGSLASEVYTPVAEPGSMYHITQQVTGAAEYWNDGFTGAGVDIAIIDSGVVPVDGLSYPGKVVNGPDLSFESQEESLRYLDTFGHGTHLAGIMAGRDDAVSVVQTGDQTNFLGMAPGAGVVNVKVADYEGSTDVSQVIAAIDWVVQHRNDNGLNIRVLNLSFGTDGTQDYLLDPLAFAVEQAWNAGIVVVVASGNDGNRTALRNPAYDPFVIAVGASEGNLTYGAADDTIPEFTNCGNRKRSIDLLAPGKSIVSLRNPGSSADVENPNAVVEDRFFLGSGTSQAAAIVSGAAALIIEQRPGITPDELKALLIDTAQDFPDAPRYCDGAGLVDLKVARNTPTPSATQTHDPSAGSGSLEDARGSHHVYEEVTVEITEGKGKNRTTTTGTDYLPLEGEQDIFGTAWDGVSWSTASAQGVSWSGGDWNGVTWSGVSWSGLSWSGVSWSGVSWSGVTWSGVSWSDYDWSGLSWSGLSWSGLSWSGVSWSGVSWSGLSWSGVSWD